MACPLVCAAPTIAETLSQLCLAVFSCLHPCTWCDLILVLAEQHEKGQTIRRRRLQISVIEGCCLSSGFWLSLHYIISVFWTDGVWWAEFWVWEQ